jgi:hypothetical protein
MRSPQSKRFRKLSAALKDICNNDILLIAEDDNQCFIIVIGPAEHGRFLVECLVVTRNREKGVAYEAFVSPVVVTRHLADRFFMRAVREQVPARNNELPDELRKLAWLCLADPRIVVRDLPHDRQAVWRIRLETGVAVVVLTHESESFLATTWMPAAYSGSAGAFEIESLIHLADEPQKFSAALFDYADIEAL